VDNALSMQAQLLETCFQSTHELSTRVYTDFICLQQLERKGCATMHVMRNMKLNMAINQVAMDCGFHDIVPKVSCNNVICRN